MIVGRSNFERVLQELITYDRFSLDCETTGLRPYHGDRLFSIIIGALTRGEEPTVFPFYFNFQAYPGLDAEYILTGAHLRRLQLLFDDPSKTWFLHNAKFDLAMLANENLTLAGTVHCTRALARVEYNEYFSYDLASCAERIGFQKDETVEKYIEEHDLWDWAEIPGKKQRRKNKYYDRVPFEIIAPYGERDAEITAHLGHRQEKTFQALAARQHGSIPSLLNIVENERRLTETIFRMEQRGVLIDRQYCERARAFEGDRAEKAVQAFKKETGRDFVASGKLFAEVFASEKELWDYTEKGNPSFESTVLKTFTNPAARAILEYRDAKSKSDFYAGFLYYADSAGVVHPNFNPDGAGTGRFSSSEPNLQNLTSEEGDEEKEFIVRRAIIPRPGFLFIMPDFDQMEYRMMLDYAQEHELIEKVKGGLDVHEATALMMGVTRKEAKTLNFMLLYGGGAQKLADALGIDLKAAKLLKAKYFEALPGVLNFITAVQTTIQARGFIRNWVGRRCYFPDPEFAYKGPNYLIQGGCADVNKFALNRIDEYLLDKKSKLVLTIHDENPIEVHEDEVDEVPKKIKELMESVYPGKHLTLTAGMEYSRKSLGDKTKGFPGRHESDSRSGTYALPAGTIVTIRN